MAQYLITVCVIGLVLIYKPRCKSLPLGILCIWQILLCVNFVNADVRLESSMFSITFDGQKLESEVLHSNGSLSPRPLSSRAINTSALSQGALSQGALIVTDTYVQVGPLGRVRYEIANVSDGVVDLGTVNITVNTRLSADEDAKAGLGASFYAYLHPFLVNAESGQANTIDISKLPATQKSVMQEPGAKHPSMKDPATKGPSTKDPELKQRDWFGWDNRYQLEAIRFTGDTEALRLGYSGDDINSSGSPLPADIYAQLTPGQVQPGGVVIIEFDYLFGVKSRALLNDPGLNLEGLLLRNLWHWVRAVCFVFWDLLDYLYALCGSWGLSIIVLAFIVRLLTLPVTKMSLRYQERSVAQQAATAPLLKEIKQKYTGIEQSEKMVEMYEQQNFDLLAPFKGMLGLFVQLPVFIALFNVIGETWRLSGVSFLWITDLSRSDRLWDWGINLPFFGAYFNALPVAMAVVTVLSAWIVQKQSGSGKSSTFALFGMAGFFFIAFYSFPAALVLYWTCSNIFQLLQQLIENQLRARA